MTPCTDVYEAFLTRVNADDWTSDMILEHPEQVEDDWRHLLDIGIFRFKYPRVDLTIDGENFTETLSQSEIQLLALYMKHEWVKRCISTWENIRQLYADSDFSQANFLNKLNDLNDSVENEIRNAEDIYDKARDHRPADLFKNLAGKKNAI